MPKGRTRRASAPTVLPYNAFQKHYVETIFPEPASEPLGQALVSEYRKAMADPQFALPDLSPHSVDELQAIASSYYIGRSNYDQGQLAIAKKIARTIMQKISDTINGIDTPTMRAAISIERGERGEIAYQSTVESLRTVERACQRVLDISGHRGPRAREHIGRAIAALAGFWQRISGKQFGKNPTFGMDGDQTFISSGPEFVFRMARAMDPALTSTDIETAIRRINLVHLRPSK